MINSIRKAYLAIRTGICPDCKVKFESSIEMHPVEIYKCGSCNKSFHVNHESKTVTKG